MSTKALFRAWQAAEAQAPHTDLVFIEKCDAYYVAFEIMPRLPHYTLAWAVSDLIAGTTVGLTIIPQVFT